MASTDKMTISDVCRRVFGLSLVLLWRSDRASALALKESDLIAIAAVVAAVVIVTGVVALIICCTRVRRRKKKRGHYHHVHDSSTLQSLYVSSKPIPEAIVTNGYVSGKAKGGGGAGGNAPKKLAKSRSDAGDQRLYVVPEWRRQQDVRNGSYVTAVHRSPSNVSAISGTIWTSNPTLTRGMYQSLAMVASSGNDLRHDGRTFSSVPTIPDTSSSAVVSSSTCENSKSSKLHQTGKKDLVRVEEDTKELLPTSSSEDTNSDRDHQVVARAYSNPVYVNDGDKVVSSGAGAGGAAGAGAGGAAGAGAGGGRSSARTGQESPFVAKVYSDYQLPRDYIKPSRVSVGDQPDGHTVVAKAFSSSYPDPNPASSTAVRRSSAELRRHSSSPTRLAGVHVARAVVRHSSSLDSNGEPKYAKPQDALDVKGFEDSGGGKGFENGHGGKGKTAIGKASSSPTGRGIGRRGKRGSFDVRQPSTAGIVDGGHAHETSDDVVYTAYGSNTRLIWPSTDGHRRSKQNVLKRKVKSSSADKDKPKDRRSRAGKRNVNSLVLKISSSSTSGGHCHGGGEGSRTEPNGGGSTGRRESTEPSTERSDGSSVVEPISESSSVPGGAANDDVLANDVVDGGAASRAAPAQDDASAIYSAPIKRDGRTSGRDETVASVADSPATPMPPPLPPPLPLATELQEEPLSPPPPPLPPITKLRDEPLTPAPAAVMQLGEDSAAVTQLDENSTAVTMPEASKQVDDPRTPLPSRSAVTKHENPNDGDGISTGKNVIGDAFKFLEDFDDMSLDAEDRL